MNTIDVMVDLETSGKAAGCVILSMGACTFNTNKTFHANISRLSCLNVGLKEDHDTLSWWDRQSKDVYHEAFGGTTSIIHALGSFSDWLLTLGVPKKKIYVWGNGAKFDLGILEAAYTACDMKYPIDYKNERCYRTLKNLYFNIKPYEFVGHKHNALHDALNQAEHASMILRKHFAVTKEQ